MSKRPTDHLEPSAKKRGNTRQLTKDDASDEEEEAEAQGEFRQASAEVMKQRRVVRPKRGGGNLAASTISAAPSNPFSGVSLTGGATNPFAGVNLLAQNAGSNPFTQLKSAQMVLPESKSAAASNSADQPQQKPAQAPAPGANVPAASTTVTSDQDKAAKTGSDAAEAPSTSKLTPHAPQPEATGEGNDQAAAAAAPSTASADFSSFVSSNKQDSPFAVKASGENSAFGNGTTAFKTAGTGFGSTAAGFGSTGGGFGAVGTGLGASTGGFGALGKDSSSFGKTDFAKEGTKANGTGFSFRPESSTSAANTASEGASPSTSPAQQSLPADQAATTGEEGETVLYEAEGTLFQFHEDTKTWRERGRGELRVNKAPSGQARLVMRQRGNLRLLLNANLWPKMPVSMMDGGKGVTFPCINHAQMEERQDVARQPEAPEESEHVPKLASFAFRKKIVSKLEELVRVIEQETSPSAAV